jgi:hypothetical protein
VLAVKKLAMAKKRDIIIIKSVFGLGLCWAANLAKAHSAAARQFFERKKARTNTTLATKALAHKLARACFYIMTDGVPFNEKLCFGGTGD